MQIIFIVLIGLVMRLISINQSLWLDEATSALVAKMPVTDIFSKFLPGDFHPPLYYLILKCWTSFFGNGEISLRIPSVIFGILTVYAVYKMAGKIPALLLATSGLHIYYSQEARMYALVTFLVVWLVYSFIKKKWSLFSVLLVAIAMVDYVSLFIIPVFWIVSWKERKRLVSSHLLLVLVFALWLPTFVMQLGAGLGAKTSYWWQILGTATIKNVLLIPVKFMIGRISFDDKILYAAIAVLLTLLFGYLLFKARSISKLFWVWLVVPIVIGIIVSFRIPTLSYFRFLFVLPAFYILVGKGIENVGKYKTGFLFLVVAVNLITSGYYLINTKFQRENWREAAKAIGNSVVVFPANTQKEALIYYGKGKQIVDIKSLKADKKDIWLSRYVWEVFDPIDSTRIKIESLGYNKIAEHSFNGVVFFQYASRN